MPGIDCAYLAMDTEEGVEVVWNEATFSEAKKFKAQEDKLRQAIGLRDLGQLTSMLQTAATFGLTKANSRVFFEAHSLRDLLAAEDAVEACAHRSEPRKRSM